MRDLLLIFSLVTILGCTNSGKVDTLTSLDNAILDSLDFHILEFDSSMRIFPATYKQTDLSEKEIVECEVLLNAFIAGYNNQAIERVYALNDKNSDRFVDYLTIDLNECGRQFVCVTSDKGEKIVYVNCFCNPTEFSYRDKSLVLVLDGGNCYFNFKINLTTKRLFDFRENGLA